jgi:RNA polymerase primary sigma factor
MGFAVKDDVLKRYLEDIRKTSPLTRGEEQYLFQLAKVGHKSARERLVSANLRFVLKVALRYRGSNIPLQDLVSEGSMGLIRAIESFDHTRGLKFISYAVWWIKAYITRAINEQSGLIRLPANQHLRVKKAIRESQSHGEMNDDIRNLIQITDGSVSIDDPIGQEDGKSFGEMMADHRNLNPEAETEVTRVEHITNSLLINLPDREAEVIRGLFGMDHDSPLNLREVGDSLNISHERVRQLRDQALKRIRRSTQKLHLRERMVGYRCAMDSLSLAAS